MLSTSRTFFQGFFTYTKALFNELLHGSKQWSKGDSYRRQKCTGVFCSRDYLRINNERKKMQIPMRASRGLKWENKTYKLKRSIAEITFLTERYISSLD